MYIFWIIFLPPSLWAYFSFVPVYIAPRTIPFDSFSSYLSFPLTTHRFLSCRQPLLSPSYLVIFDIFSISSHFLSFFLSFLLSFFVSFFLSFFLHFFLSYVLKFLSSILFSFLFIPYLFPSFLFHSFHMLNFLSSSLLFSSLLFSSLLCSPLLFPILYLSFSLPLSFSYLFMPLTYVDLDPIIPYYHLLSIDIQWNI